MVERVVVAVLFILSVFAVYYFIYMLIFAFIPCVNRHVKRITERRELTFFSARIPFSFLKVAHYVLNPQYGKVNQYESNNPQRNVYKPRIIEKRFKRLSDSPVKSDNANHRRQQSLPPINIKPTQFSLSNVSTSKNTHPYSGSKPNKSENNMCPVIRIDKSLDVLNEINNDCE